MIILIMVINIILKIKIMKNNLKIEFLEITATVTMTTNKNLAKKLTHHCHYTPEYRGAKPSMCNL